MKPAFKLLAVVATACVLVSAAPASAAQSAHVAVVHHSGSLPDGATWIADVPANWSTASGVLILYTHGYHPTIAPGNPPVDAPDPTTMQALLDRGYALVGSSYAGPGWAMASAVDDQFGALAAIEATIGKPRRVLGFGTSMGGLVSALEDERANGRLDGVLTTCGLVAGAVDLNNYQLDAEYTIRELLMNNQSLPLVHFASMQQAQDTAQQLIAAAQAAQQTPRGRARLALAMAFLHTPTWASGQLMPAGRDFEAQEQQQFATVSSQLFFMEVGRFDIETAAHGNGGWNLGVNYERVFHQLGDTHPETLATGREVEALYRAAGLNLDQDLDALTAHATIPPDPNAVATLRQTSQPTGRLTVPELDIHTISDQLVPVEQERDYRRDVERNGSARLLRQAFVQRQGHCNFTPGELIASVEALLQRVETGHWDALTEPERLNAAARQLGLGDSAFVHFEVPRLPRS
jgi:hypothetical protein